MTGLFWPGQSMRYVHKVSCSPAIWNAWGSESTCLNQISQSVDILPGHSSRFSPNAGLALAVTLSEYSAACAIVQGLELTSPQDISEATRPNGSCLFTGPAAHVAPSLLAESLGPAPYLASGMPKSQLRQGPGTLCTSW